MNRITFYNKRGDIIDSIANHRFLERPPTAYSKGEGGWLYVFDNNLYLKELYCDTLYQIKEFNLHPRYLFNTGGLAVPYEIQMESRYDLMAMLSGKVVDRYEKYVKIHKILEDNKYLYFTVDYRRQVFPAIYDKTVQILQIMPPVTLPLPTLMDMGLIEYRIPYGFENDLDGGLPFWPQQMISDKEMMCVYTAEDLLGLDKSKITDPKLNSVLNGIDYNSNPVIAIVTLKE
jgi:hypothetical protein